MASRALREAAAESRRRLGPAQAQLTRALASYRKAESRLMALQAAGASRGRVAAAKARTRERARDVVLARRTVSDVSSARAVLARREQAQMDFNDWRTG